MPDPGEFRFHVETPPLAALPMARLAEILRDLAALFGDRAAVHVVTVEEGSGLPVIRVDTGALPAVRERIAAVTRGEAPVEAMRAFLGLGDRLGQGGFRAALVEGGTGVALAFPGPEDDGAAVPVRQDGSVDGEILRVGGQGEEARIVLRAAGEILTDITAPRALAKELARHLYEPVRLHGAGRWTRLGGGRWVLDGLRVERFTLLSDESLADALAALHRLQDRWDGASAGGGGASAAGAGA